ncbi:MAG: hypothetical protein J7518_14585 [Nocardioidaceae bacterium]|nr:hypothetical protein [Nocardioidaceae bacterium]
MTRTPEYDARVRAWADALRSGDTRTWAEFRESDAASPGHGPLPGNAQLELVRRLAERDVPGDFGALADLVLATPSPGRGLVDPPLPWPGGLREFGTPAVEPDQQPVEELVRAACGVLVKLLRAQPETRRRVRRPVPRRRAFVLAGAPVTVAAVRETLRSAGLREGGRRATYLVLGGPFDHLMAERWCARIAAGEATRWRRSWRAAKTRPRGWPDLDLPTLASSYAEKAPGRVHVVLGTDPQQVADRALGLLGVRARVRVGSADIVAADLLRRLNPLLVLAAGPAGARALVTGPWADAVDARPHEGSLGAPSGHGAWSKATATRMAEELAAAARAGDYAVHGDPAVLLGDRRAGTGAVVRRAVPAEDVLDLALDLIASLWEGAH